MSVSPRRIENGMLMRYEPIRLLLLLVTLFSVTDSLTLVAGPENNPQGEYLEETPVSDCKQSAAEQNSLMTMAEKQNFTLRRIEFFGLTHTSDQSLRNRMTRFVNEGDLFSRKRLLKSLQNMSKLKRAIYPVRMRDVVLHLNRPDQVVDMTICFRERRR